MKNQTEIPAAFKTLKKNAGENWDKLKKYFNQFLDLKREINNSNLNKKTKKILEEFVYKKYYDLIFQYVSDQKQETGWDRLKLYSYSENVLATLYKSEYNSKWVCFINDSENKSLKSGNKKYPNLD